MDLPVRPLLLDLLPSQWDLHDNRAYRRNQVLEWIFKHRVAGPGEMTNLPAPVRQKISEEYDFEALKLVQIQGSQDITRKLLWQLRSGDYVESVLIPASLDMFGERSDRHTLCVSTQVGCAFGCRFCASGLDGWKRNLSSGELVAQALETERVTGTKINNIVFMGMGEPLANYPNLMRAIEYFNSPWGLEIGARHMTVSTSGLASRIRDLAGEPWQIRLALSLHGATDEVRDQIMPINQKIPLAELLAACAEYQQRKNKILFFEYILIEGINDSLEQARLLARHALKLRAKVNLIPYNLVEGLAWKRPSEEVMDRFTQVVRQAGVVVTLRREKGHDIDAACGQLRLRRMRQDEAAAPEHAPLP